MSISLLVVILLVLLLIGVLPTWNYSSSWGYSPVGIIALILIIWLLFGSSLRL